MLTRLKKRKYSSTRDVMAFSDRSGCPFPMHEMVYEPGTKLFVHYTESDGKYNRVDWPKDPIVPPDAQRLPQVRASFITPNPQNLESIYIVDAATQTPLYVDLRGQDALTTFHIGAGSSPTSTSTGFFD